MSFRRVLTVGLCLLFVAQSKIGLAQRVLGLDVSAWQGDISQSTWNDIHNVDNRQFVFIRSSRGGTTGFYNQSDPNNTLNQNTLSQRYDDPYFIQNMNRATTAGLFAGAYHFGRPDVIASTQNSGGIANSGADEADHFIQMAGPWMRPGYLVPIFDLEAGQIFRTNEDLALFTLEFSDRIYDVMGIRPGIYVNGNYSSVLQAAGQETRDKLAMPMHDGPSVVDPAYYALWNARWPSSPNVQADNPKDTATSFYGPWDDYGDPHPWNFWQYTSTGNVSGISPVDLNVSHGDIEYLKDSLVPAVWMNDASGDWNTLASWNSGQPVTTPVPGAGQSPPASDGPLPTPRLPGAAGSGVTSGQNDTVILERPNADITVSVSSGEHNIRKLYMREALDIQGGTLTINYDPTYNFNVGNPTALRSGNISAQFSGPVTLGGPGTLNVHTVQVDAGQTFTVNGGTLNFHRINLMPHATTPATLTLNTNVAYTPPAGVTPVIANGAGAGASGRVDLGGTTRTFAIGDGTANVDFAINAAIVNGNIVKTGAGTLGLAGSMAGDVSITAGGFAPGASIGALTTNSLTLHDNTTFDYEIDPFTIAADVVNVANGLNIGNNVSLNLSALNPGQVPLGAKFAILSYDDGWNGGTFVNHPHNSQIAVGGNKYRLRYNDSSAGVLNGAVFGNAITLTALTGSLQTTIHGFAGYYAPENWSINDTAANEGFVDTSGAPNTITIVGPDDASSTPGMIDFSIQVPASGTFSFDWLYASADSATWDSGWYINGQEFLLSNENGHSGQISIPVNAGDVIGWRVRSVDSLFGAGILTISNFSAPGFGVQIPEPSALLLSAIVGGLAFGARRHR